jgi:hypothetical protein
MSPWGRIEGVQVFRVRHGLIAGAWGLEDTLGQLGLPFD